MEPRITFSLLGAICLWASAPVVLAAQLIAWSRTGAWPPWTFGDGCAFVGLGRPAMTWAVGQQLCDWIWSWPLWLGLFVCTAVLAALLPRDRRAR
jgi:hypothetical protein